MDPGRGILNEGEDGAALVRDQTVSHMYHDPAQGCSCVFHGHTFAEIGTVKGPGVDDLLSVGVDDLNVLATLEGHSLASSGRDSDAGCGCHAWTSLRLLSLKAHAKCRVSRQTGYCVQQLAPPVW